MKKLKKLKELKELKILKEKLITIYWLITAKNFIVATRGYNSKEYMCINCPVHTEAFVRAAGEYLLNVDIERCV